MKELTIFLLLLLFLFSCTTVKEVVRDKEIIRYDSITRIDTVYHDVLVQRTDTISKTDTLYRYKSINIDTLTLTGQYVSCDAGINQGIFFMNLYEDSLKLRIKAYNRLIKVKEKRIRTLEDRKVIIKKKYFWQDLWFWISISIFTLLMCLSYCRKI